MSIPHWIISICCFLVVLWLLNGICFFLVWLHLQKVKGELGTPTKSDKRHLQSVLIAPKHRSSEERGLSFRSISHLATKPQSSPRKDDKYNQKIKSSRFLECVFVRRAVRPFGSKFSRRGGTRAKQPLQKTGFERLGLILTWYASDYEPESDSDSDSICVRR